MKKPLVSSSAPKADISPAAEPLPTTKSKRSQKKAPTTKPKRTTGIAAKSHVHKSKRNFPHYTLESARKIADTIKQFNMGNPWSPKDVAQAMNMGSGPNYFYITQSARDYGFTLGTRESDKIELTDLGRSLVYPKTPSEEKEAIFKAFNNIDLFKKVYEYYQGENLPDIQYLKNTLKVEFEVPEDLQDDFYAL